jgi:hypothetical protein
MGQEVGAYEMAGKQAGDGTLRPVVKIAQHHSGVPQFGAVQNLR